MYVTWQTIITAAAVVSALSVLLAILVKIVRFLDRQKQQDEDIKELKAKHNDDIAAIKREQTILVHGILACLKGLKEQGCNGPVTEEIKNIEDYLNENAHK